MTSDVTRKGIFGTVEHRKTRNCFFQFLLLKILTFYFRLGQSNWRECHTKNADMRVPPPLSYLAGSTTIEITMLLKITSISLYIFILIKYLNFWTLYV